jgi:hypothetical protein
MMPSNADHRIGIAWIVSTILFVYFGQIAARRIYAESTWARWSIFAFAFSWAALCFQNTLLRFHAVPASAALSWWSEFIRDSCCVTLLWMALSFRSGRIRSGKKED